MVLKFTDKLVDLVRSDKVDLTKQALALSTLRKIKEDEFSQIDSSLPNDLKMPQKSVKNKTNWNPFG